jgi:AcrR family transcriptional regulator
MKATRKKQGTGRPRDRASTRKRLIAAVGTVLARKGFGALGINSVAKEARVDKVLIYRYFGGMSELLRAFGEAEDFWPSFEELADKDPQALFALPPGEAVAQVLKNYLHALRRRPITLEILAWETVERNELTAILETVREELALRILKAAPPGVGAAADVPAITALLAGAINYLLVRSRLIRMFNSIDLRSDAGWKRLEDALVHLCRRTFVARAKRA